VHLVPVGPRALLAEVGDALSAAALASWAGASLAGSDVVVDEVVPGAATVLFDGVPDVGALRALLASAPDDLSVRGLGAGAGELVEVDVRFDGEDLAFVAQHWDTDVDGVVARLVAAELVSAFCGFAPGFAYLAGLSADPAVPRLATPRPRLVAGSVALADRWCGVYPSASPGGWRVVGHTDAVLWDVDRDPPALLAPGTRVRFVAR
jgi:KipI family sensor histidine kinase inhibitor